jgi:hypothetical protein
LSSVAYLNSSALVKLIALEDETVSLRPELERWPRRLAAIEVTRTARRLGPRATPLATRVLAGVDLLAIDRSSGQRCRSAARSCAPWTQSTSPLR